VFIRSHTLQDVGTELCISVSVAQDPGFCFWVFFLFVFCFLFLFFWDTVIDQYLKDLKFIPFKSMWKYNEMYK
jgi:hypothetical protein